MPCTVVTRFFQNHDHRVARAARQVKVPLALEGVFYE
jgi:hypothetical protein